MNDVTLLLSQLDAGDPEAAPQLLKLVYDELRRLAASKLALEKPGQTLQATALVHEAWLRLVGGSDRHFTGRNHFFAASAEAMRRILVDNARRKACDKRGGNLARQPVKLDRLAAESASPNVVAISEVLDELEQTDPVKVQVVKLRYFVGMTLDEVAAALDMSRSSAERHWRFARAWLAQRLRETDSVS